MARIIKLDQVEKSVLEAALATCSDLADQRRLTVALQAMGGRSTAQEIAEKNGVSRSTVFNWIKLLRTNPIGAFFRIRSNRPVRLSGKQLIQLRQECASGSIMNAKQLRHRLVQLGMAVSAPSAHYWLDRIRGVSENRERGATSHRFAASRDYSRAAAQNCCAASHVSKPAIGSRAERSRTAR